MAGSLMPLLSISTYNLNQNIYCRCIDFHNCFHVIFSVYSRYLAVTLLLKSEIHPQSTRKGEVWDVFWGFIVWL